MAALLLPAPLRLNAPFPPVNGAARDASAANHARSARSGLSWSIEKPITKRRQGRAQFVAQDREETVLGAVGLLGEVFRRFHRLFRLLAIGNVSNDGTVVLLSLELQVVRGGLDRDEPSLPGAMLGFKGEGTCCLSSSQCCGQISAGKPGSTLWTLIDSSSSREYPGAGRPALSHRRTARRGRPRTRRLRRDRRKTG